MITTLINVQYNDRPDRRTRSALCLGHQGENGAREIIFNLADMISDYGPGTVTLLHMRGTDPAPYIIDEAAVTAAAPTVTWTISDTDTAAAGYGLMELRLAFTGANGESLAKSVLYGTVTYKALAGETEIPSAMQAWYDALIDYIDTHSGGSVDPEDIAAAVEDYFVEHPITESDPTVPAWAKAATKPTYTASEVGALPDTTTVSALVECLSHVAWVDGNGEQYLGNLRSALLGIVSISATYTQSGTVYDTDSLDSLKSDLVVTATYESGTTETVTAYTLSGTLSAGTSTVTVAYGGLTDTISVTVTMSRTTRFGTFHDGYSVSKSAGGTVPKNGCFVSVTAARAAIFTPVANLDDTITVTDSSKYNLAMLGLTNNTAIPTTLAESYLKEYYTGDTRTNAWRTSDHLSPSSAPYIFIALKKMDGTAFTEAELADGAAAVFSYTPA